MIPHAHAFGKTQSHPGGDRGATYTNRIAVLEKGPKTPVNLTLVGGGGTSRKNLSILRLRCASFRLIESFRAAFYTGKLQRAQVETAGAVEAKPGNGSQASPETVAE